MSSFARHCMGMHWFRSRSESKAFGGWSYESADGGTDLSKASRWKPPSAVDYIGKRATCTQSECISTSSAAYHTRTTRSAACDISRSNTNPQLLPPDDERMATYGILHAIHTPSVFLQHAVLVLLFVRPYRYPQSLSKPTGDPVSTRLCSRVTQLRVGGHNSTFDAPGPSSRSTRR